MITQTIALFYDAYRDLNSRKLFWITLILSALVVIAFGFVGINERGITVFGAVFEAPINSRVLPERAFYQLLFNTLGLTWLTPWSAILALISTASIFPDFLTGGSIDLYLVKPISRLRLFLTKYATGLMFVGLQVLVFCLACFLLVGVKGGVWLSSIFVAVPLVVCYFSYLFCITALVGVMTRSTLASLLLSVLFMLVFWGVHLTETILLTFKVQRQTEMVQLDRRIESLQREKQRAEPRPGRDAAAVEAKLAEAQRERGEFRNPIEPWHKGVFAVKTVLPKQSETVNLMNRWTMQSSDMEALREPPAERHNNGRRRREEPLSGEAVEIATSELESRSPGWIIGTSLAFEAVVLAVAAWFFCRKDF